jgi:iron complex outermembrane receptor protein
MTYSTRFGAVLAASVCVVAIAAPAQAEARQFNIRSGSLKQVLEIYARETKQQILYKISDVRSVRSPGVRGSMSDAAALKQLLAGTGFEVRSDPSGAFAIGRVGNAAGLGADEQSSRSSGELEPVAGFGEDIIVTAQKRSERLQDVPLAVSVIDATALSNANQTRLADYFASVPGLSMQPGAQSITNVVIRGISTGPGNPTVGVIIDDVPFGSSVGALTLPDFDPGDIKQIEVLRGPQGTLYGASSMGGLIKYETIAPSTERVTARLTGGLAVVDGAGDPSYSARGSVNIPLGENIAVRASGYYRRDAGWIDNPVYGDKNINWRRVFGGRVALLIRPTEDWTIKLSALFQRNEGGGTDDEHLSLGDQKQAYVPGSTAFTNAMQAYSAHITGTLGPVTLVSVTGYNVNDIDDKFDISAGLGFLAVPTYGVDGFVVRDNNKNKKFTQELRANIPVVADTLDLQLGGYYTDEVGGNVQDLIVVDPATGAFVALGGTISPRLTFKEKAIFGNVTLQVTDQIDIQAGARQSWIRQGVSNVGSGPIVELLYGSPTGANFSEKRSSANVFTYSVTPRFKINNDFMLYARAASGYRAAGANVIPGVPPQYLPDRTRSYEIGAKGNLADRMLTFDLSLYYIDWKDIQLQLQTQTSLGYTGNGGSAKSEGIELAVDLHPMRGLTFGGWIAVGDAVLRELPASSTVPAKSGDPLPDYAKFSGSFHANYEFALSDGLDVTLGAQLNHVGKRMGRFGGSRLLYPDYSTLQLTAGIRHADGWEFNLYANNVTNSRGQYSIGRDSDNSFITTPIPTAIYRVRPREIGLTVSRTF